ncbi:MAG: ADP-ribosylglycohydrolase family protein [Bradymonadales bacterium]|jgi:ADP-ribosyl-[dinitrogen reductase] hydrolase
MREKLSFNERARGAILGAMIGDALGSRYSFMKAEQIRNLQEQRAWNLFRISDDTQAMVALMEALASHGADFDVVSRAYMRWANSEPEDIDVVSCSAFMGKKARSTSELWARNGQDFGRLCSNQLISRQIPWSIVAAHWDTITLRHCIDLDTRLSHDGAVCSEEAQIYAVALSSILRGQDKATIWKQIFAHSRSKSSYHALLDSYFKAPRCDGSNYSDILVPLQVSLYYFWHCDNFVATLRNVVSRGGACDTNAAATGALLGAFYGTEVIPMAWLQALSQNPDNTKGNYSVQRAMQLCNKLLSERIEADIELLAA